MGQVRLGDLGELLLGIEQWQGLARVFDVFGCGGEGRAQWISGVVALDVVAFGALDVE